MQDFSLIPNPFKMTLMENIMRSKKGVQENL